MEAIEIEHTIMDSFIIDKIEFSQSLGQWLISVNDGEYEIYSTSENLRLTLKNIKQQYS